METDSGSFDTWNPESYLRAVLDPVVGFATKPLEAAVGTAGYYVRPAETRDQRLSDFSDSFTPNPRDPLFELLAFGSAAFGVRSRAEIIWASVAHVVYWLTGGSGLDGMTNALAGAQIAKGRYRTAAIPSLKATYDTFRSLSQASKIFIPYTSVVRSTIYMIGWLLAWFKII